MPVQITTICLPGVLKNKKVKVAHTRVLEPIPVLGSQPAGDVSHKPGGRCTKVYLGQLIPVSFFLVFWNRTFRQRSKKECRYYRASEG